MCYINLVLILPYYLIKQIQDVSCPYLYIYHQQFVHLFPSAWLKFYGNKTSLRSFISEFMHPLSLNVFLCSSKIFSSFLFLSGLSSWYKQIISKTAMTPILLRGIFRRHFLSAKIKLSQSGESKRIFEILLYISLRYLTIRRYCTTRKHFKLGSSPPL